MRADRTTRPELAAGGFDDPPDPRTERGSQPPPHTRERPPRPAPPPPVS